MYVRALSNTIFYTASLLVAAASFDCFTLLGNHLRVDVALTSLSLFNILRFPLFTFPQVVNNAVEATVSFNRITDYLLQGERETLSKGNLTCTAVSIRQGCFAWQNDSENESLDNVSLELEDGDFCGVLGSVGSGKSMLIASILGENVCLVGTRHVHG